MHETVTTGARTQWLRAALIAGVLRGMLRNFNCAVAIMVGVLAGLLGNFSATPFGASATAQDAAPTLMIVLDGSGSMWGRIDGTSSSKLGLVRDELKKVLRDRAGRTAIGLSTFGAQAGSSCSSAQTPVPPATDTLDALDTLLEKFNPQGRGPVVLGLKTAMQSIDSDKGPARLLLIHDSPDNCGEDVCALAQEFSKSNRVVPVDVLSIALKPDDAGSMQCLTKATGGRLIEAGDASAVAAGLQELIGAMPAGSPAADARSASLARPETSGQTPTVASPDANANAQVPSQVERQATGVLLNLRLGPTSMPAPRGLSWRIVRLEPETPAFEKTLAAATTSVSLTPGRYQIVLQASNKTVEKTVTVSDGARANVDVAFDGGFLEIAGAGFADTTGGPAAPTEMVHIVGIAASGGDSTVVWTGARADTDGLLLKPGRYEVIIRSGWGEQTQSFDITAGSIVTADFKTRLGRLIAVATDLSPAQLADVRISIAADDAGAPDKRRPIAVTTAANATFDLPAGPYHVSLSAFGATVTDLVVLAAGQTITHALRLKQMALKVTSHIGETEKPADADVRYRLWRAGQLDRPLDVRREAEPLFHLAPGKYRLESSIGQQNVTMIREFDVGTAAQGLLELRHEAGRVLFSFPGGNPALRDNNAYWQFFDQDGRRVWRTFDASPNVLLLAGAYSATVSVRNATYEAKFVVVAGQTQTVLLGTN